MEQTKIFNNNVIIDERLKLFGVTKDELVQVVHQVVMARNSAVSNDPRSAAGLFAYIYGTRALRELFLMKGGWKKDCSENIEAVYNKELNIKVIYQSADIASSEYQEPKSLSEKGPGSRRIVINGHQGEFFPKTIDALESTNSIAWFLYVAVNGSDVTAELSCPRSIENGQFEDFAERIFIVKSGEFGSFDIVPELKESEIEEFEINVSRK